MARRSGTVAVAALVAVLVLLPLLRLGQVLWQETDGAPLRALGSAGLGTAARHTLVLAVAVTLASVPVGVSLALVLRRADLPGRAFWRVAVLLPIVVPDFVLGYSWTQAYARAGFTDTLLGVSWPGLLGPVGVWLVLVVNAAPLVYLVVAVGLAARAEPDGERAARISGAGSRTALVTITLRLLLPAVAASAVLVFVLTLATFAVPQVLGAPAGFETVTTRIYADLSIGGDPASFREALALALLLVLVTAACVAPADALLAPRLRTVRPADPQAAALRARPAGGGPGAGRRPGGLPLPDDGAAAGRAGPVVGHARARGAAHAGQLGPRPLPGGAHPAHRRGVRPQPRSGRRRGVAARGPGRPRGGRRTQPVGSGDGDADHPDPRAARLDARRRPAPGLRPLAVGHPRCSSCWPTWRSSGPSPTGRSPVRSTGCPPTSCAPPGSAARDR